MIEATLKIDQRFKKRLEARYGSHRLEAGVLANKPHRAPLPRSKGLTGVLGGPARKKSRKNAGTVADVGETIRRVHHVDWIRAPFQKPRSRDMRALVKALGNLFQGKAGGAAGARDALRDVIRNPILRKEYGRNTRAAAKRKGFNRFLVDTGQFLLAIAAKVTRV